MKFVAIHHMGLLLERPAAADKVAAPVGVVLVDDLVVDPLLEHVDQLLGLEIETEPAVDTEVPVVRCLLTAAGAGDGRDLFGGILGVDLETVHGRVLLLLGLAGELRDVPGDDGRATGTPLPVFDECLGLPAGSEPVGVGLPKVGRRDRLLDVSSSSGLLEALEESLVAESVGAVELRPEVVAATARVVVQPAVHERRREDQVDVVLAAFPVDADLGRVLAVGDVTDLEVVELSAAEPALELQRDDGLVAGVAGHLDHRLDVVLEVEHICFVGLGVVVTSGLRRDPVVGVGDLVTPGDVLGEQAERDAVVAVGLLGSVLDVVGVVDPANNRLRGVLCFVEGLVVDVVDVLEDRLVEFDVGVFTHPDEMSEQLLMSVVAIVLPPESKFIAELEEEISVDGGPAAIPLRELFSERLDALLRVRSHDCSSKPIMLRVWLRSLHRLFLRRTDVRSERATGGI